jgi:hypothetical protein
MVALALSEDSITQRDHRETIIESLAELPNSIREVPSKLSRLILFCTRIKAMQECCASSVGRPQHLYTIRPLHEQHALRGAC